MTIRPLTETHEFRRCLEIQREAWGWADEDLLPVRFLVVLTNIGGLVLGAYDGDRLVGFLNAMPGIRNGRPYWHSHMLGVAREYWNSGIGTGLKRAQRDHALERGIHFIEWTFDPLESKNAYLNIEKLGVIIRRYYVNHYGETTAVLQKGLASDRVLAEWWVKKPRVRLEGEVRRIRIPADIQSMKSENLGRAREVQLRVREEFLKHFSEDFFVAGFERKGDWSDYLLIKGASRVHTEN